MSAAHDKYAERRSVEFPPSIWGDHFLNTHQPMSHDGIEQVQVQELKAEVKRMLDADTDDFLEKLNLIDQVQRLGIGYLFVVEIDRALERIHRAYFKCNAGDISNHHDLYATSLLFRLLRQQGYKISCDIFDKFKETSKGCFKESIVTDTKGLLSLYEASHLRVHGEEILEESLPFTSTHLMRFVEQRGVHGDYKDTSESLLVSQVNHALKQCIRKGLIRIEARRYITIYEQEDSHSKVLLTLAKLDFNLLQKQHQNELHDITRWWKDLDFGKKLPFARDRVVECYFWILGVYFEPEYTFARNIGTKIIMLTSVMDDIYDVYGTPEELKLLTDEIERWDSKEKNYPLPDYMLEFIKALFDVFHEIEDKLADDEGKSYRMFYAKEAMKLQAKAYFNETKWLNQLEIPTVEEYMSVSLISSGYVMLVPIVFLGMGRIANEHAFEWSLGSENKIVMASARIARLMDDIVSHKFEQERGHVASVVECYMNQHGATEERAKEELWKEVDSAWKDINEICLCPHPVPEPLLARILNLARVMDVLYKDNDRYTHPDLELIQMVASVLLDPIEL